MQRFDDEICRLLKKRDKEGMKILFSEYYRPLVLWADTFLNDTLKSEDIVQDLFLKLWEQEHGKKLLPETLKYYLFTSVKNYCLNLLAKDARWRRMESVANLDGVWEEYDDFKEDIIGRVGRAMEVLPPRNREVVREVYINGLHYKEAAEKMDVSVATVKTLLVRSLKVLREELKSNKSLLFFFIVRREKK